MAGGGGVEGPRDTDGRQDGCSCLFSQILRGKDVLIYRVHGSCKDAFKFSQGLVVNQFLLIFSTTSNGFQSWLCDCVCFVILLLSFVFM